VLLTAPATSGRALALCRLTPGRRIANRALAAIGAATAAVVLVAMPGVARADAGSNFTAATNEARHTAGLAPLSVRGDLVAAATAHAKAMASSGVLAHTVLLGSALCCWQALGENVGRGSSAALIQGAFLASPEHRANILGDYTEVGIGYAVDSHGQLWVSELFRLPTTSAVQPKAVPKPVIRVVQPTQQAAAVKEVARATSTVARPPVAAVAPAAVVPDAPAASRSLARVPLDAAHRLAAQLSDTHAITGTNPVSRLLDFAAQAAAAN
jgi:uncharacterized protein YkwD